jgi:hypothetical protein
VARSSVCEPHSFRSLRGERLFTDGTASGRAAESDCALQIRRRRRIVSSGAVRPTIQLHAARLASAAPMRRSVHTEWSARLRVDDREHGACDLAPDFDMTLAGVPPLHRRKLPVNGQRRVGAIVVHHPNCKKREIK